MVKAIGSSAKTFLSDERKPEMNFFAFLGGGFAPNFQENRLNRSKATEQHKCGTNLATSWHIKGKKASHPVDMCGSKTTFKPGETPYERGGDARRLA